MSQNVNEVLGIEAPPSTSAASSDPSNSRNTVATIILWIAAAEMLAALILAFVYGNPSDGSEYFPEHEFHGEIFFPILIGGFISGMMIIGFAEVIKLLQKISDKA